MKVLKTTKFLASMYIGRKIKMMTRLVKLVSIALLIMLLYLIIVDTERRISSPPENESIQAFNIAFLLVDRLQVVRVNHPLSLSHYHLSAEGDLVFGEIRGQLLRGYLNRVPAL